MSQKIEKVGIYRKLKISGFITILLGIASCSGYYVLGKSGTGGIVLGTIFIFIGFAIFVLGRLLE